MSLVSDLALPLPAWILEKFHVWTHHEGDSESVVLPPTISYDDFLTNVTVYWMTNSIASSTRIYYEYHNLWEGKNNLNKVPVPTAAAAFQSEIIKVPEDWIAPSCDLQQYTSYKVVSSWYQYRILSVLHNLNYTSGWSLCSNGAIATTC